MTRRGVTILELLVVIGLLLALASVALPIVVTRAAGSALPEAQQQVEAALMLARADAQRDSAPVRVRARACAQGGMELVAETVELRQGGTDRGAASADADGSDPVSGSDERTRLSAVYTLPRGIVLSDSVKSADAVAHQPLAEPVTGGAAAAASNDWVLLAVFLPSGEAIRPGPRYLIDERGRAAELVVEPWSGRLSIRPVSSPLSAHEIAGAAPDAPVEESGR
jgi:Tfp pilus assembly protein FimT